MFPLFTDSVATSIPIRFTHAGHPAAALADGAVSSSDETIVKVSLSDDKAAAIVTPVGPGTASISYGSGQVTASLDIEVAVPTADAAEFDPAAAAPAA